MADVIRPTVTLHYEERGSGDSTLVFLHGWCDSAEVWTETMAEFAGKHRCLAPDMRGHGKSGQPRDLCYMVEALANDVVAICEAAGVTRPVLVGHSFGGMLAAAVAARFPGFARAVVVVDQALDFRPFGAQMRSLEQVIRSPESHMAFRNQMLGSMMTPLMPEATRARIIAGSDRTPVEVGQALWAPLFEYSDAELADFGDRAMAALSRQPSCVIDGQSQDTYYTTLAGHAPDVEKHVLACGHWVHLERPAEFREILTAFLARLA